MSHQKVRLSYYKNSNAHCFVGLSPNDIFRSNLDKLAKSIIDNLYPVTSALYAKKLIPEQTKDDILTVGISDSIKASKLVAVIDRQLQLSFNPDEYFIKMCYVLAGHHTTLRNIVSNMLQSIG